MEPVFAFFLAPGPLGEETFDLFLVSAALGEPVFGFSLASGALGESLFDVSIPLGALPRACRDPLIARVPVPDGCLRRGFHPGAFSRALRARGKDRRPVPDALRFRDIDLDQALDPYPRHQIRVAVDRPLLERPPPPADPRQVRRDLNSAKRGMR